MARIYNRVTEKALRRSLRNRPTTAEAYLWYFLKGKQIAGCKFRRQYSVGAFVVDFFAAEVRLALELDGDVHDSPAVRARDESRQHFIESFGIRFLRFSNDEVFERMESVLEKIEQRVMELRAGVTPGGREESYRAPE